MWLHDTISTLQMDLIIGADSISARSSQDLGFEEKPSTVRI